MTFIGWRTGSPSCGVKTGRHGVPPGSTGFPVFEILEQRGFEGDGGQRPGLAKHVPGFRNEGLTSATLNGCNDPADEYGLLRPELPASGRNRRATPRLPSRQQERLLNYAAAHDSTYIAKER